MIVALFVACTSTPTPVGDSATTAVPTGSDTGTPVDSGPTDSGGTPDADGDGIPAPEDCDDSDDDVYPGAPEEWDGKDGDCDGRVDADGAYTGSLHLSAVAIYEGVPRSFELDCPAGLSRVGGVLDLLVTCTPDPGDELAQLLLGATLSLTATDDQMGGGTWSGDADLASSDGWSTTATLNLSWPSLDRVSASATVDTRSLDAGFAGSLDHTP